MSESLFTVNLWAQNSKNGVDNQHRCTQSSIILLCKLTTETNDRKYINVTISRPLLFSLP
jgi:hypothetical protein